MNPMNLDSIFKNVTIYGNISIKHRVHVFKETKTKEQVEYYKVFTSSKSKGGSNGIPSVSFRGTDDCIILLTMYLGRCRIYGQSCLCHG